MCRLRIARCRSAGARVAMGDEFRRLIYQHGKGVLGWKYAPAAQVHRMEDKYDRLIGFREDGKQFRKKNHPVSWPWDYVHFRLLGPEDHTMYGTSMCAPLFRSWRQLCNLAGTMIWTTRGPKVIENIVPGDVVYCHDYNEKETHETRVKCVLKMGEQKVLRVRTRHRQIMVTEDHGLLALDVDGVFSYKRAKDLRAGKIDGKYNYYKADKLVLPALTFGSDTHTVHLSPDEYSVYLTKPCEFDSVGIMDRIRECRLSVSEKVVHAFLQGNAGVPHAAFVKLAEHFDLPPAEVYYRRGRKKSPVGTDLKFVCGTKFMRIFGYLLGNGSMSRNNTILSVGVDEVRNKSYTDLFSEVFKIKKYHRSEAIPGERARMLFSPPKRFRI